MSEGTSDVSTHSISSNDKIEKSEAEIDVMLLSLKYLTDHNSRLLGYHMRRGVCDIQLSRIRGYPLACRCCKVEIGAEHQPLSVLPTVGERAACDDVVEEEE